MEQLPIQIHKHWFGYVVIAFTGAALIALAWIGLLDLISGGIIDPTVGVGFGSLAVILIAAVTIIQLYVYGLSYLLITDDGVEVKNWLTIFVYKNPFSEWPKISRASESRSVFGQWFDFGTIEVRTTDGDMPIRFTMTPDAVLTKPLHVTRLRQRSRVKAELLRLERHGRDVRGSSQTDDPLVESPHRAIRREDEEAYEAQFRRLRNAHQSNRPLPVHEDVIAAQPAEEFHPATNLCGKCVRVHN